MVTPKSYMKSVSEVIESSNDASVLLRTRQLSEQQLEKLSEAARSDFVSVYYYPKDKRLVFHIHGSRISPNSKVKAAIRHNHDEIAIDVKNKIKAIGLNLSNSVDKVSDHIITINDITESDALRLQRLYRERLAQIKGWADTNFSQKFSKTITYIQFYGNEKSGTAVFSCEYNEFLKSSVLKRIGRRYNTCRHITYADMNDIENISLRDLFKMVKQHERYGFDIPPYLKINVNIPKPGKGLALERFSFHSGMVEITVNGPPISKLHRNKLGKNGLTAELTEPGLDESKSQEIGIIGGIKIDPTYASNVYGALRTSLNSK